MKRTAVNWLIDKLEREYNSFPWLNSEACIKAQEMEKEQLAKELYEFGKLVLDTFHSEGRTHSGKARLARIEFDEWFNSLNKQD